MVIVKSFSTLTDAESFVKHGLAAGRAPSSKQIEKYYAVRSGRVPGIYVDWPTAQKQITGFSKPQQKSFLTRAEAEAYMREGNNSDLLQLSKSKRPRKFTASKNAPDADEVDENVEPGTGPLPKDSEDGFDSRLTLDQGRGQLVYKTDRQRKLTKMVPVGQADNEPLVIYTDGAALGNGRSGATAGVGVYFGPLDTR